MANLLEKLAARLAFLHADRVHRGFLAALQDVECAQTRALETALAQVARSDFGRQHRLAAVRTIDDLRQALPIQTYEDYRPHIERVANGDTGALFSPGQQILMFATSSGTTAKRKLVPVTPRFVKDYRRGWHVFGLKLLRDHPTAVLRTILQCTSRHDEDHTRAGIPIGAITGLLARSQKRIVRRFYAGRPELTHITDPRARYYALMRCAIERDVGFAVTANPATLIRLAQTADDESECLIRDVHDGTLSADIVSDDAPRMALQERLRPNSRRAAELEDLRREHAHLRPRDYWRVSFVSCWTGGSMGHYLGRLADWWGDVPVRDIGLLASEGRVSIPFDDGSPAGVLDVTAACFEFIPIEQAEAQDPPALSARELEVGRKYVVVLSNTTGMLRYRLDDVVRVTGFLHQVPVVEFLHRAGRVSSVAGEKITENQLVSAVRRACADLGIGGFDFVAAPVWDEVPFYRLSCPVEDTRLAAAVDQALSDENEEYCSRRKSGRLGGLRLRLIDREQIAAMDRRFTQAHGATAEQYKRPCLHTEPGADDAALGIPSAAEAASR